MRSKRLLPLTIVAAALALLSVDLTLSTVGLGGLALKLMPAPTLAVAAVVGVAIVIGYALIAVVAYRTVSRSTGGAFVLVAAATGVGCALLYAHLSSRSIEEAAQVAKRFVEHPQQFQARFDSDEVRGMFSAVSARTWQLEPIHQSNVYGRYVYRLRSDAGQVTIQLNMDREGQVFFVSADAKPQPPGK